EVVDLLGDIGHDLKNLLQPVVSGTWLLQTELDEHFGSLPPADAEKVKPTRDCCNDVIGMIQRTAERIHDRVKEIADCVKGLSAPPRFAPCKVAEVVENVLQTLRVLATEKGLSLRTEGLEALPTLMADERRLYNAFYNLVNNAIPEVPKGGSVTVRGHAEPGNGVVLLSVADTGRGMPPEVRDRLFTAGAVSTKAHGTGLGTKIVKDVVEAHKGTITVESQVGVGTTFHVRLPLDPTRTGSVS
ncbi:MAG: sensor histidine kinase, partial [Nitrospiraceae bacterium]